MMLEALLTARGVRQVAACAAVSVAGVASLATSEECLADVSNGGSVSLSTGKATTSAVHYRVRAPIAPHVFATLTVRSTSRASVHAVLVYDTQQAPAFDGGVGPAGTIVSVDPEGEATGRVELPSCTSLMLDGETCDDFGFLLMFALTDGTAADVEWDAVAAMDECESDDGRNHLFEIRRD